MDELVCNLGEDKWILDLGAGPGSFPYQGTRARIVAVDLAFPAHRQDCTGRVLADSGKIPLAESKVNLAVCNHTLEHFHNLESALAELDRVVCKGGKLWVSVPDGYGFDDRLYRLLFKEGGHVNRFTLEDLVGRVEKNTGFRGREFQSLQSGFVYLQPPTKERLSHYPRRARVLNWIPAWVLRRGLRSLNSWSRRLDRWLGSNLSRYGWAVLFVREDDQATQKPLSVEYLRERPSAWNVCYACGSGNPDWLLQNHLERRLFGSVYRCARCDTVNTYSPPPTEERQRYYHGTSLEEVAKEIFPGDEQAAADWVGFWKGGRQRSLHTLNSLFQPLVLLDFNGRRVLDVGCGAGGLGELVGPRSRLYAGVDPSFHVLRFAKRADNCTYVQCDGRELPFADGSCHYLFAMDVLEHVQGGFDEQVRFLKNLKRALSPLGMIFLSTPNRLYPKEGHSGLLFPQFLPSFLADWYVGLRRPAFLHEHGSFAEIRSLTPSQFRRCLQAAGLSLIHELPCGMDRPEFRKTFPIKGLLSWLGLGWYPHAEFWGIAVHSDRRAELRHKLKKNWRYEENLAPLQDFSKIIDFDKGHFAHQLGPGWYWHERDRRGFRWTSEHVVCYLQTNGSSPYVEISGFSQIQNELELHVDGICVGRRPLEAEKPFQPTYLVPVDDVSQRIFTVEIRCRQTFRPGKADGRQLGVMIFSVSLRDTI